MTDRFPLIVNNVSQKVEELVSGDSLDLSGNGIVISGDRGAGKYLTSDGSTVQWDSPGDVYLTATQTVSNKTLTLCTISGSQNTITNIPNSGLVNSSLIINNVSVPLGGSVTTPNDNTTYTLAAVDAVSNTEKIVRLADSASVNSDITLAVGSPASVPSGSKGLSLLISRTGDKITFSGTVIDDDTVTTLQSASGGSPVSGAVSIAAGNFTTVSQVGTTITIAGENDDTITRLRGTSSGTYSSGDVTFLDGGASTVTQGTDGNGDPTITYSSTDTVTRVRGGLAGSYVPSTSSGADVTITGGSSGNVTVSQSGNTINIDSQNDDTITRIASGSNSLLSGDFQFTQSGATTITQSTDSNTGITTINFSSANDDTGASFTGSAGIIKSGSDFQLKNGANFTGNTLLKWDSGNANLTNSLISDNGSQVTIGGDLLVTGTQTIMETTTLVVGDKQIELRKGDNLTADDGGIQVNLTTNSTGIVTSYKALQWYNAGGYWRSFDGSIANRFVTENETQVLNNKTLVSPTLTGPNIGAAVATTINGLSIATTASAVIDIESTRTLDVDNDLTFKSDSPNNSVTANFRQGGNVAYTSDTLASFSSTTSTQLRGLVSDTTGLDRLVFQTNPNILTGITTTSTGFTLLNSGASAITAFGAADAIDMGKAGGTFTINQNLVINEDLTVGANTNDTTTINGVFNVDNADLTIRGTDTDPMRVGRGIGEVNTNTAVGVRAIQSVSNGSQNTAVGFEALLATNSGASNTAIGNRVLRANGVGIKNVGLGSDVLLVNTSGEKNVAVGNNAMESNNTGSYNLCLGHYAGYAITGSGNVLIGPSDAENSTNATFAPPNIGGDRQLVIGSGTEAWVRGDSNFKVTIPNEFSVVGDATIGGSLTVNGTLTSINSNVIEVDDKEIELGSVVATTFNAVTVNNSATITGITPTAGLIPGMEVIATTGGITVPTGTTILSITGNEAILSNSVSGDGTCIFTSPGATDLSANGGGIRLKGDTDKRLYYDNSRTDKYWVMTENLEIAFGKKFVIGNQLALSTDTLGPTVVNSSLESVGTLSSLAVSGSVTIGGVVTEKVFNSYSTSLAPSSNVLTVNIAGANTICGTPTTDAIDTWAFTGVNLNSGQSKTITLILTANTSATYGDACSIDGVAVTNGVQWSGGSPPVSTANTDILTFVVIRDNSGIVKVFGQGNTDFS